MVLTTRFDIGQKVYRVVIDPETLFRRSVKPTYVALEFVVDKITITKKRGISYHCKRDGAIWHGWAYGSAEIFFSFEEADEVAQALNKEMENA